MKYLFISSERHDTMRLYLAGNNKLITDYRLTDDDTVILYKWLRNDLYVVSLDLRYNNIADEGAANIAKLIEVRFQNILKYIYNSDQG